MGFREQTFWESPRIGGGMAKNGISRATIWRSNICRRQIDKSVTNSRHLSPFGVDDLAAGHQDSQQSFCSTKIAKSQNQIYEHLQQHFLDGGLVYMEGEHFFQILTPWSSVNMLDFGVDWVSYIEQVFPTGWKLSYLWSWTKIYLQSDIEHWTYFWHQHDRFWNCWYVANVQRCDQELEEAGKVPQPLFHYLCLCHPATPSCTEFYVRDTSGATSPSVFLKRM